jgi:hypothetical protein
LQIYIGNIDKTEKQLKQLTQAIPVSARIANLNGEKIAALYIPEETVQGLLDSSHVEKEKLNVLLFGAVGDFPLEDWKTHLTLPVVGTNSLASLDGLDTDTVTWLPGYGPEVLADDEPVCVADTSLMEANGWSLGDSFPLNLYYYRYGRYSELFYDPLEIVDYRIVGQANLKAVAAEVLPPEIIIPFDAVRVSYHRQGIEFFADSASFTVSDPLKLNDFKAEMKALDLSPIIPAAEFVDNKGNALLVDDTTFINAATRLQESLSLLKGFLPLLVAVLAAIGYFVSYLMIQNRRDEYAVLRLLGLGKVKSMGLYFIEIALITFGGSMIGALIATSVDIGNMMVGAMVMGIFFLCFTSGSVAALWRLGKTNVMLTLTQMD